MLRRGTILSIAVGLVAGSASLAAAASSVDAPAQVVDRAERLDPTFEEARTPEERAVFELVTLVNLERTRRGLPILLLDPQVTDAARVHAAEMAANRRMQHRGTDGSDGGVRLTRAGYVWASWGENIGAGHRDPETLFESWMTSRDHRFNLLGDFADVGVGAVASPEGVPYWVLLVARAPYGPVGP